MPGAVCVGTARGRDFGILVIRQCREMAFSDVDDELARMEDMSSASELQAVLRGFYPEIEDSDRVRVIVFSLLVSLVLQRIDSPLNIVSCFFPQLTSTSQGYLGPNSNRIGFAFTIQTEVHTPVFASILMDKKIHPVSVAQFLAGSVSFFAGQFGEVIG